MITHNFWHFWTFHVKRVFQENSPVHINVCRLDALVEPDGFFSFSQSFFRYSTLLMHGSHILCSTSCPRLQKKRTHFWFVPTMEHNTTSWSCAELDHGRTCDVPIYFQMFSSGKRSHSAGLILSDANLSLASAAFSFCFQIPFNNLNLLNCRLCLDCGTWALHVRVLLQIYDTLTVVAGRR